MYELWYYRSKGDKSHRSFSYLKLQNVSLLSRKCTLNYFLQSLYNRIHLSSILSWLRLTVVHTWKPILTEKFLKSKKNCLISENIHRQENVWHEIKSDEVRKSKIVRIIKKKNISNVSENCQVVWERKTDTMLTVTIRTIHLFIFILYNNSFQFLIRFCIFHEKLDADVYVQFVHQSAMGRVYVIFVV